MKESAKTAKAIKQDLMTHIPNYDIHLLWGKEEDYNASKTKSGCRKLAGHIDIKNYVYYKNSQHVTCNACLIALEKIKNLKGVK